MPPPPDHRRQLATRRAAALALFVAVAGYMAIPMPYALSERKLAKPEIREEVDRWYEVSVAIGLPYDREGFDRALMDVTGVLGRSRATLLTPVVPFTRLTGTGQSWYLFTAPDRTPKRLEVEIRGAAGPWRTVHRGHDPEHAWASDVLAYRRVRAVYDSSGGKGVGWARFTRWIAARALADFPEAERVRVSFVQTRSTTPREPPNDTERRVGTKAFTRAELAEPVAAGPLPLAAPPGPADGSGR